MKIKKLLHLILLILVSFTLVSCGGFFEEETKEILAVTSYIDQFGTTVIKITYSDDTEDEFKIPKGAEGNGIKEIATDKVNGVTTLTVTFTDELMEPVVFDVADGKSIIGVESRTNEETGDVYMVVLYNDGTESDPHLLPRGEKGEDGNGFSGFDKEDHEDGSKTYYFHFTQSEDVVVTIPAPEKGETGNGVSSIVGTEIDGFYVLTVNYTDGTKEEVTFNKPKDPNAWYSGTPGEDGPSVSIGRDGDYYFDTYHKVIYAKENNRWNEVVSFADSIIYYDVVFNLNDMDDGGPKATMNGRTGYTVVGGSYFTDNGYGDIPTPTRTGYKFLGWYKTKVDPNNISPNNAPFTDMVLVNSNITLYACWQKIETN